MLSPDAEDVFNSGFFSDDKYFQILDVHGLTGDSRPSDLDEMGYGFLFVMNRGLIFLCTDDPKKGKFNWNRAGYAAAYFVGGLIGVVAKAAVDVAFDAANFKKKIAKAFEHPLSFCLPYTDIESVDIIKFDGIFGRLKDVVVEIGAVYQDGSRNNFWIRAKNDDETWLDLICTMKFLDEAQHIIPDYINHVTGSYQYGAELYSAARKKGGDEHVEEELSQVTKRIEQYIERKLAELGITDDDLLVEKRDKLARYKEHVSKEIYSAVME